MEKFIVIYSASGHDGDDDYCFGNCDVVAVEDTYEAAYDALMHMALELANDFVPEEPYDETISKEEWDEERNRLLDIELTKEEDGTASEIRVYHNDEMFPHLGLVKIIRKEF